MKSYEEKREVLRNLAELYLATKNINEDNFINVNDVLMNSFDFDCRSFLIFMVLTYPKEEAVNYYSMDIDVDFETQNDFVETEYRKVMKSKSDMEKKGKMVLDDAKDYYNDKYFNISDEKLNEMAKKIEEMGFHI